MHAKIKNSLGLIPIITNINTRSSSVIDVDSIYIEGIHIVTSERNANITFRVGGEDSNGKLHSSPAFDQKLCRMTITDPLFSEIFLDSGGNLDLALTEDKLELLFSMAIPRGNELVWSFQDNEITLKGHSKKNGKVLFKHEKK